MVLPLFALSLVVAPIALGRLRRRSPHLSPLTDLLMLPVLFAAFDFSILEGIGHLREDALREPPTWAYGIFLALQPVGLYVCGRVFRQGKVNSVDLSSPLRAKAPASKPNTRMPRDPDPRR